MKFGEACDYLINLLTNRIDPSVRFRVIETILNTERINGEFNHALITNTLGISQTDVQQGISAWIAISLKGWPAICYFKFKLRRAFAKTQQQTLIEEISAMDDPFVSSANDIPRTGGEQLIQECLARQVAKANHLI